MKKTLFTLFYYFGAFQMLSTQTLFKQHTLTEESYRAYAIETVDIDLDGDFDIVSIMGNGQSQLLWYENIGDTAISSAIEISRGEASITFSTADLDMDGDIDIVTGPWTSENSGNLFWFENNGMGEFPNKHIIQSNNIKYLECVIAKDLDGDLDLDIITATNLNEEAAWYENLGGGNFSQKKIIGNNLTGIKSVSANDLDEDGDFDIITASENALLWYENIGGGNFGNQTLISNNINGISRVFTEDINSDGKIDILCSSPSDYKTIWFENLGDATFSNEILISSEEGYKDMKFIDMDNDQDRDLLTAGSSGPDIKWLENNGSGGFNIIHTVHNNIGNGLSVAAADLTGDGLQDVIAGGNMWDVHLYWYGNNGDGTFSSENNLTGNFVATSIQSFDAYSRSNDSDLDIVFALFSNNIYTYDQITDGKFKTPFPISSSSDAVFAIHGADLDGDNQNDLIIGTSAGKIKYWNTTSGYSYDIHQDTRYIEKINTFDFDEDGDKDIFASTWGEVFYFKNLGNDTFSSKITLENDTLFRAFQIDYQDINGDGYEDILSNSAIKEQVIWYQNTGNNSFSASQIILSDSNASNVSFIDFDQDNDVDILCIDKYKDEIGWHENLGNMSFAYHSLITNVFLSDLTISEINGADMDIDGDIDIVVKRNYGGAANIIYFENLGNNIFADLQFISDQSYNFDLKSMQLRDLDNDSDLDILTFTFESRFFWYENMAINVCSNSYKNLPEAICSNNSYNFNGNIINQPGEYYDTLQNACGQDSIIKLILNVLPEATPSVSISAYPGNEISFGTEVTFTANTNYGGNVHYQWKKNGVNVGADSIYYSSNTLSNNDEISCEISSNFLCILDSIASSNIITILDTSIVTNTSSLLQNDYILYPNPSKDFITITGYHPLTEFKIFNSFGGYQTVKYEKYNDRINISNLPAGVYFLEIDDLGIHKNIISFTVIK